MDIIDALRSIDRSHEEDVLNPLTTVWGDALLADESIIPLSDHPRPQMYRDSWISLNGWWDHFIISDGKKEPRGGRIRVPFSPECRLSGVERVLQPGEELWYRKSLCRQEVPDLYERRAGDRVLLHFGAVDQEATVYVGDAVAGHHMGGYLPFTMDITDELEAETEAGKEPVISVMVRDISDTGSRSRGKQTLKRGGMYYTAQSGIWQSVWLELVPGLYISDVRITPATSLDHADIRLELTDAEGEASHNSAVTARVTLLAGGDVVCTVEKECPAGQHTAELGLDIADAHLWSPEDPYLYGLSLELVRDGRSVDSVASYLAMRCFTVERDGEGINRFFLNHRPYYLHGVLDQGYWPDGLYTAPSDEAFIYDITQMKSMGFNMLRKHVKIEAARWYYHCDRLGMIVWQDMVSGGSSYAKPVTSYLPTAAPGLFGRLSDGPKSYQLLSRADAKERAQWLRELEDTIRTLYNCPCIAVWVLFNEGWGQFNAAHATVVARELDHTRLIDQASGWFDQGGGDFRSVHNYFRPLSVERDEHRAFVVSEYGGYACHIDGHSSVDRIYGYKRYEDTSELQRAYRHLMGEVLPPLIDRGLSGTVYTQLSDVEEEVNGILTYDRRVCKLLPVRVESMRKDDEQ